MASTYIGLVLYFSQDKLNNWLSNVDLSTSQLHKSMAESLFIKRTEFAHEQEVRIIMSYASDDERIDDSAVLFDINPNDFIEEYLINPRLTPCTVTGIKNRLVAVGADMNKIRVSQLYQFSPYPKPLVIG